MPSFKVNGRALEVQVNDFCSQYKIQQTRRKERLMSREKSIASAIAVFTLSAMVMAAQMQMPDNSANKQASAATNTLTGMVSDSMCGAHHMAKDKSPAECTRMCVKQGQKYALVVGQKVYTLEGHEDDLDKLAGQRVTVKGTVSGDTVNVASVTAAKKKPGA